MRTEKLVQEFEIVLPDHAGEPEKYGKKLLAYCSYKALDKETKRTDSLSEKEFRVLTYDMMLAWETPNAEIDSSNKVIFSNISVFL
jgi:hypothetical protein